jgi:hypothetical protein
VVERLCDAKIEYFHRPVGPHLDVGWFQIAMHDALLVGRFECLRDLFPERQRFIERDGALRDAIGERRPLDQLHHERGAPIRFLQPVDVRDVRMVERREHLRFALEPGEALGIERELGG